MNEKSALFREYLETSIGCPFSEMNMFCFTADYLVPLKEELQGIGVPCEVVLIDENNAKIFYSADNENKVTEMRDFFHKVYEAVWTEGKEVTWSEMINEYKRRQQLAENEKQAITTQQHDKPNNQIKKCRSR